MTETNIIERWTLPKLRLDDLIALLIQDGFEVIGPRIDQGAIVYGPVRSAGELPIGWTDQQSPGTYRLERRGDAAYFGYAVGPHSWKKYLFPPLLRLWQARRSGEKVVMEPAEPEPPPRAFLGIRACELHAIAVQDKAFLNRAGQWTDPHYARARAQALLIAVECEQPGGTCFCTSMGTGPSVGNTVPFDLALTELDDTFVVRAGNPRGQQLVERLGLTPASQEQWVDARGRVDLAAQSMGRTVDVTDIRELLHRNQENPRWNEVADRCLACTNCTLVCPTCFCSSVEDTTDLSMETAERVRRWDSCFNPDFAQVHGGNFRPSIPGRYRQWLTHKFASWFDQFGVSGCVGCGRCITWCPVGIDVTEEITAIRATDGKRKGEDR
jgi:sulfhydrogenase subunit beta (sulfur reductase)